MSNADSSLENRSHDFYLIFGQLDESKSPWITANWKSDFEPYFNLLIKHTENSNDTGIRAIKYNPEKRISKKDNKEFIYHSEVKLGRLKWNEKSHEKWTTSGKLKITFSILNFGTRLGQFTTKDNHLPTFILQYQMKEILKTSETLNLGI